MFATVIAGLLLVGAVLTSLFLYKRLRAVSAQHAVLSVEHDALTERFRPIVDADAEKNRVLNELETQKEQILRDIQTTKDQADRELKEKRIRELGDLEVQKQSLLDDIRTTREQAEKEMAEARQRELGSLEGERARLAAEITAAREEQQRAAQSYQEERLRAEAEKFNLELNLSKLREEFKVLDEEANLQSFGFYKPRYEFATSARYQSELEKIRGRQKEMIQDKKAAVCQAEWTVNGDRAAGKRQTNQTLKLILRAFNGECDAAIAKVKYNNAHVMEARIRKAFETINSLVVVQQCQIVTLYLSLKLEELYLAHEYQEKVQEEKEEQRRIREQMREEEIAQRELLKAQADAEREEARYEEALRKATADAERAVGAKQERLLGQIEELQRRLEEAHANKERAIARAQMTRSGHVYVISNVGSFGEEVYKIGMTRRLDPMDRVRELGDASVPFHFDVHAIIYSEDAPGLETKLHRAFHDRRVNQVNERKEFFRVGIGEIAEAVRQHHGEIEIVREAEAVEYRKTMAMAAGMRPAAPATEVLARPYEVSASVPHAAERVGEGLPV